MKLKITETEPGGVLQASSERDQEALVEIILDQRPIDLAGDHELQSYIDSCKARKEQDWQQQVATQVRPDLESELNKDFGLPPRPLELEILFKDELRHRLDKARDDHFHTSIKHSLFVDDPLDLKASGDTLISWRQELRQSLKAELDQPHEMSLAHAELQVMVRPITGPPPTLPFDLKLTDAHLFCFAELGQAWLQKAKANARAQATRPINAPKASQTPEDMAKGQSLREILDILSIIQGSSGRMRLREKTRIRSLIPVKIRTRGRHR